MKEMDIFDRAVAFAVQAHSGMTRKTEPTPYILHPLEVACIAATMTDDRDVLAAAVLHDTVEDTSVTAADIEEEFGPRVAGLVASETEDKRTERPPAETWRIRKEESLRVLEESGDINVKILWLSEAGQHAFLLPHEEKDGRWLVEHFQPERPGAAGLVLLRCRPPDRGVVGI